MTNLFKYFLILITYIFNLNTIYADILDNIKNRNKIIVAIDIGTPPFGSLDTNAKPVGYDIDVANLLAKDLEVELEIIPVISSNRIPYLISKKVDVTISNLSITEERKKIIDFTIPYAVNQTVLAGIKNDKINSLLDISEDESIAITRTTPEDLELTNLSKQFKNIRLVRYEDNATTISAILTGKQNYVVNSQSLINSIKNTNPDKNIEIKFIIKELPFAIAVRKNNQKFKDYLNKFIVKNMNNGFLPEKYKYYFNQDIPEKFTKF